MALFSRGFLTARDTPRHAGAGCLPASCCHIRVRFCRYVQNEGQQEGRMAQIGFRHLDVALENHDVMAPRKRPWQLEEHADEMQCANMIWITSVCATVCLFSRASGQGTCFWCFSARCLRVPCCCTNKNRKACCSIRRLAFHTRERASWLCPAYRTAPAVPSRAD